MSITLKQSTPHEGHESLLEEQRNTQQKVVLFQTLSYLVSSHSEVSVWKISSINHSFTAKSSGLSTMNATLKESLPSKQSNVYITLE
jgi:hypothetical protein